VSRGLGDVYKRQAEHSGRQAARVKGKVMLELSPSDCWMSPAAATDSREDAAGRKTHICE
ncbi:hypothetical protein KZ836_26865, partial [Pseudomonas aeruginosa]|uniref:hypothetical protein n=1 Tax=Pseudomonas aeruginosa TaxID=287 RepID=UPI001CA55175